METILDFEEYRNRRMGSRTRTKSKAEGRDAEIVFFTGVRFEYKCREQMKAFAQRRSSSNLQHHDA